MKKSVIVYLVQNDKVRKEYLKTSLYFLFKNFNQYYKYPVLLLHTGDFDEKSQNEIILGIRGNFKSLISFKEINKEDFHIPEFIDEDAVLKSINNPPVTYWRNMGYRNMCRFYMKNIYKYVDEYEYYMRLDDDSIIESKVPGDMFEYVKKNNLVYAYNIINIDCHICTEGLKSLIEQYLKDNNITPKNDLNQFWHLSKYNTLHPKQFFNNFHITNIPFWQREEVKNFIDYIDQTGNIYLKRWGDAPIQTFALAIFCELNKINQLNFEYSKRLHRQANIENGEIITLVPDEY